MVCYENYFKVILVELIYFTQRIIPKITVKKKPKTNSILHAVQLRLYVTIMHISIPPSTCSSSVPMLVVVLVARQPNIGLHASSLQREQCCWQSFP